MCSAPKAPKIKTPEYKEPEPIDYAAMAAANAAAIPPPQPLPAPRQAAPTPIMAPPPVVQQMPVAPPMPRVEMQEKAPPPVLANTAQEAPIVKKRKSKRQELQQANKGAGSLSIKRDKTGAIGQGSGTTGASGLNIPK